MAAVMKAKLDLLVNLGDVHSALEQRGIAVNQANTKRLVDIITDVPILANAEFYEGVPMDQPTLLMYGFTFAKGANSHDIS